MTSDFGARVGDLNTSQMALQGLTTQIADIVRKNQQAARALSDNLAELDKRAADLQSQLGDIGAPLKVISFKLSQTAPLTPLIIAAALAALAGWTAEGLRPLQPGSSTTKLTAWPSTDGSMRQPADRAHGWLG